jgi:hypothetical protein
LFEVSEVLFVAPALCREHAEAQLLLGCGDRAPESRGFLIASGGGVRARDSRDAVGLEPSPVTALFLYERFLVALDSRREVSAVECKVSEAVDVVGQRDGRAERAEDLICGQKVLFGLLEVADVTAALSEVVKNPCCRETVTALSVEREQTLIGADRRVGLAAVPGDTRAAVIDPGHLLFESELGSDCSGACKKLVSSL